MGPAPTRPARRAHQRGDAADERVDRKGQDQAEPDRPPDQNQATRTESPPRPWRRPTPIVTPFPSSPPLGQHGCTSRLIFKLVPDWRAGRGSLMARPRPHRPRYDSPSETPTQSRSTIRCRPAGRPRIGRGAERCRRGGRPLGPAIRRAPEAGAQRPPRAEIDPPSPARPCSPLPLQREGDHRQSQITGDAEPTRKLVAERQRQAEREALLSDLDRPEGVVGRRQHASWPAIPSTPRPTAPRTSPPQATVVAAGAPTEREPRLGGELEPAPRGRRRRRWGRRGRRRRALGRGRRAQGQRDEDRRHARPFGAVAADVDEGAGLPGRVDHEPVAEIGDPRRLTTGGRRHRRQRREQRERTASPLGQLP